MSSKNKIYKIIDSLVSELDNDPTLKPYLAIFNIRGMAYDMIFSKLDDKQADQIYRAIKNAICDKHA